MSSSSAATQLGRRQLWASIRDSLDGIIRRRLPAQQPFWSRPGLAQFAQNAAPWAPASRFGIRRPFSSTSKLPRYNVRRSCTSGGLFLLGLSSPSTSAPTVVATCAAAADSAIATSVAQQQPSVTRLAAQAWTRSFHTGNRGRGGAALGRRSKSSKTPEDGGKADASRGTSCTQKEPVPGSTRPESHPASPESIADSMSKYIQTHLPKMPHRPTLEELLAAANGFWERLKVRFKWFSIRSMRPWNVDEWGAFVSWFLFGHLIWILVGTTTFFSLIIFTFNTVFAQEELAKWVGDYLTRSAGVTVIFESAIVPRWKDGVISFHNVFVSRRPGQVKSSVQKGSSSSAAARAAAAKHSEDQEEDDGNYTQYDLTVSTVNVTLSFIKWWNGRGLLKDVEIKGVRGVVDRTAVVWTADKVDPLSYRQEHKAGDFEIEHFKLEDLLVTVHQPGGFRPFPVSIYSCELPQLRKQWFFYDFLAATHMSGSIDGSLFTIHPRQMHGIAAADERAGLLAADSLGEPSAWKKFSRLRIDGLRIEHLNRGVDGPFGWIYEGNVDIVADVMFPADVDEGIVKVMSDVYDKLEEAVTSNRYIRILEEATTSAAARGPAGVIDNTAEHGHITQDTLAAPPLPPLPPPPTTTTTTALPEAAPGQGDMPRYLVMDLRLHLNDVRAAVPLFPASDSLGHSRAQSYVNAALIRPMVAYINAKRTYIPIGCRIVKRASDFDGAWSVYDCGLMDDCSAEVYAAFARDVVDQQTRVRRLKKVGFWTLSMVVHALLAGVAGDLM